MRTESFLIELEQDKKEASVDALAKLTGLLSNTLRMSVPRDEFYAAAKHYQGACAVAALEAREHKYKALLIKLVGVTLAQYCRAMFDEGRWDDRTQGNIHKIEIGS